MMNRTKLLLALLVGVGVLSLSACGTMEGGHKAADPTEIVAARVEARWKALIDGKVDAAYEFLSPASRASLPLAVYKGRTKPGMWREAKAKSVTCDADLCKANVWLKYDIHNITGLELNFEESWIKEDGGWWYVQKK